MVVWLQTGVRVCVCVFRGRAEGRTDDDDDDGFPACAGRRILVVGPVSSFTSSADRISTHVVVAAAVIPSCFGRCRSTNFSPASVHSGF
ncbi:unnamed protein product [Heligmosomoides polygyrus]|uniref:Secreted protein n=1 Tax=Heligmosomoides polygyrus TaxID=6339 RepID=A0A183GCM0_HELPZ|nr:unnamed protein product [Heligmosomoides polygyrus]